MSASPREVPLPLYHCSNMSPGDILTCYDRVREQLMRKAPGLFPELPHRSHVNRLWRMYERGEMSPDHSDHVFFTFLARVWSSRGNEGEDRVTLPEAEAAGVTIWLRDGWLELREGTAHESHALRVERMGPALARIFQFTAGPVAAFN
jgi:hypothetical protein